MKTADFFNLFKKHQLGKKRNFGAYRVIDGDCCQVLVRASNRYGVPNGSELIAITFTPEITLWHASNLRTIKHTVRNDIVGSIIGISSFILDENADNLLDSGIIEIDETNKRMLVEIGDTPWLFEYESSINDSSWSWLYNIGTKVNVRCGSIAKALVDLKLLPNTIRGLGWMMECMPSRFQPDGIGPEDRSLLSSPVNPMDYGFQIEHCKRESTYTRGAVGTDMLLLKKKHASTPDGLRYSAACEEWNKALHRYDDMRPISYENISIKDGEMVLVGGPQGTLYLKGEMTEMYASNNMTVQGWHKLLSKSNKIRLRG